AVGHRAVRGADMAGGAGGRGGDPGERGVVAQPGAEGGAGPVQVAGAGGLPGEPRRRGPRVPAERQHAADDQPQRRLPQRAGLQEEDNGAFVYNMVQMSGGSRVAFDEAHHGESTGGDLGALLTSNPWGWAIIYGVLLSGLYVLWSARRLGPPLPVPTPDQRRP